MGNYTPPALTEEEALNITRELCEEVVGDEQLLEYHGNPPAVAV
jgi:hypothetical protein